MIPGAVLASFENIGYELGMLRGGSWGAAFVSTAVPCLADSLTALDENHPLLAVLKEGTAGWRHRVSKWIASLFTIDGSDIASP